MALYPTGGYPPIEDHGLIGDGETAALVARDGSVNWMCVPRFDSPPLFCSILDIERGGAFRLAPDQPYESRQHYEEDTGVLVTELRGGNSVIRITDALTMHAGADITEDAAAARCELLRLVRVIEGEPTLVVDIAPRGGADAEPAGDGLRIRCRQRSDLDLYLWTSHRLRGLRDQIRLRAGEQAHFALRWGGPRRLHHPAAPEEILKHTLDVWRRWMRDFRYDGPRKDLVRRSAITIKLLDHFRNGAIVAAPTSSLPEAIGGVRNWDYRYAWIRDAAFSVYALHRIGHSSEAAAFLGWVLSTLDDGDGQPRVLYDLDGKVPEHEVEDPELEGYRGSAPVRWGNGAAHQEQRDVYGELLDCAHQWAAHHGNISAPVWRSLRDLAERARQEWRIPDHGIWEVRTSGRLFTYSAAMCQVALDRAARLSRRFGLEGDIAGWEAEAETIRRTILEEAWDERLQAITEHIGGGGLDASILALPLRRVIRATEPRMVATTEAIQSRLGAGNGLIYRYLPDESPDGLPGKEGAFLLCSFWLVDNLAHQGRVEEAMELFDSLCDRANPLGLLPEQIEPSDGSFLGNFPQAFSHIGVISSGVNLVRAMKRR